VALIHILCKVANSIYANERNGTGTGWFLLDYPIFWLLRLGNLPELAGKCFATLLCIRKFQYSNSVAYHLIELPRDFTKPVPTFYLKLHYGGFISHHLYFFLLIMLTFDSLIEATNAKQTNM